ncbi:MAG: two-component regulator propeller domain-containing protein [Gammaproteobacteria bacterium]|nr:two-component regulator propeller domain-containing protein [Gammaproteobacteria bacterium]
MVLIVASALGLAQPPDDDLCWPALTQWRLQNWDTDDGLALDSVLALARTADGMLWAGTEDGLSRFDGSLFESVDLAGALGGDPAYIEALAVAADGSILVATSDSGVLEIESGNPNNGRAAGSGAAWINVVIVDDEGAAWAGGRDTGLLVRSSGSDQWTRLPGLHDSDITALTQRVAGGVWVGYSDGKVQWFDGGVAGDLAGTSWEGARVEDLVESPDGALWVATRSGLYAVTDHATRHFGAGDGLEDNFVETVLRTGTGQIWIGTATGGIGRLCGDRFEVLNREDGLPSDRIEKLLEDGRGGIWAATGGGGISRLSRGAALPFTPREGLPPQPVLPVLASADGVLWAGTYGEGLVRIQGDEITTIELGESTASHSVFSIEEDSNGDLWVGTRDGLYRLAAGEVRQRFGVVDGLPHATVGALLHDGSRLFVGHPGGVAVLEAGEINALIESSGGIRSNVVGLLKDEQGQVWVATHGDGLYQLSDGQLEPVPFQGDLPTESILSLFADSRGALWIGTSAGLARWDGDSVGIVDQADGYPESNIFSMRVDAYGDMWLSGNRGVYRIALDDLERVARGEDFELSVRRFNRADGMPSSETNGGIQPAVAQDGDGRLWYPTMTGIARFDPAALRAGNLPPRPRILNLRAQGAEADSAGRVVVPPVPDIVEFAFSAVEFVRPEAVEFQYRIVGLDDSWYTTIDRQVAYRQMPPGEFRFELRTRIPGESWSEPASLAFAVDRHLMQYPATWIGAVALFSGAAWFLLTMRRRRLALQNQRIQDTQKLESLGQLAGGIAHDFNNILSGIIGIGENLAEDLGPDDAKRRDMELLLSAAHRGAGLTEQLLAFARRGGGEARLIDLSEEVANMAVFLRRVLPRSIEFHAPATSDVGCCRANPSSLQQVILNLALNARDAMPEGGTLSIDLTRVRDADELRRVKLPPDGDFACLAVADTGTGMDRKVLARLFEPFYTTKAPGKGTGLGLAVTHNIIRELGGAIDVESELGTGTCFRVYVPLESGGGD